MAGIALYDALTIAARRMKSCCVKTLNDGIGDRPKSKHVTVAASGHELHVTVDCPVCKTKTVVRTDNESVKVEPVAAA